MKHEHRHLPNHIPGKFETASRAELNELFLHEFGRKSSPRTSLEFMRQNLAWAGQARIQGQSPKRLRKRLLTQLGKATEGSSRGKSNYRPGTRLVREWQGIVYEVTVIEDGYAWEGRTYGSLTEIATRITGTKWSGPRFFGLTGGKSGTK